MVFSLAVLAAGLVVVLMVLVDVRPRTSAYVPRHSAGELVQRWQREERDYQAALDKVWAGAICEWARRADLTRRTAWC